MDVAEFTEALLQIMERKTHWGWPAFTSGQVPKTKHHIHMEQEWEVYVRDFPVLLGWAFVQCPDAEVRRDLAENLYEEETGGLVAKSPHPELFLRLPDGLGYEMQRFDAVRLLPRARVYRMVLDDAVRNQGWEAAVAVTTLFIEGTAFERGEVDGTAERRPAPPHGGRRSRTPHGSGPSGCRRPGRCSRRRTPGGRSRSLADGAPRRNAGAPTALG